MSIQIYEDSSNVQGHGKKTKRGEDYPMKTNSNIPKPTKRVALGNITNQVHGSRIQPTRAAKEKHKVISDNQSIIFRTSVNFFHLFLAHLPLSV